jgi:hypothetical protein
MPPKHIVIPLEQWLLGDAFGLVPANHQHHFTVSLLYVDGAVQLYVGLQSRKWR